MAPDAQSRCPFSADPGPAKIPQAPGEGGLSDPLLRGDARPAKATAKEPGPGSPKAEAAGKAGEGPLDPTSFLAHKPSNVFDGADGIALLRQVLPLGLLPGLALLAAGLPGLLAGLLLPGLLHPLLLPLLLLGAAALLLLPPLAPTLLRERGLLPNPHAQHVVRAAMTHAPAPQEPGGPEEEHGGSGEAQGGSGPVPGSGEVVVFLLGARDNAAFKMGPDFRWVGQRFGAMLRQLERLPGSAGYLGGEALVGGNQARGSHVMAVTYWRSHQHLMRYTHDRSSHHSAAMRQLAGRLPSMPHIGLWHETYVAQPGLYESLYVNCPPMGLGAALGLVPATGRLKTARGRMAAAKQSGAGGATPSGGTGAPPAPEAPAAPAAPAPLQAATPAAAAAPEPAPAAAIA